MENQNLKYRFPFKIVELKTNSFSTTNISDDELGNFNMHDIEFGIKPRILFHDELEAIKIGFDIAYEYKGNEILKIDVDTIFEFDQVDELNLRDKGLLATLLGISFSTIRGIILNRTIGSFMNNIYLPIINPTEIINSEFPEE